MKIKKIRIKNYRSIMDSGDIYLYDKVTILAGKNESGKTTILEAIEDFDINRKIRPDAKPIWDIKANPEILITFILLKNEVNQILGVKNDKGNSSEIIELELIKAFPDVYSFSDHSKKWFEDKETLNSIELLNRINEEISKLGTINKKYQGIIDSFPDLPLIDNIDIYINALSQYKQKITISLNNITDELDKKSINESLTKLDSIAQEIKEASLIFSKFLENTKKLIPHFVYFVSFDNSLPFEIPLSEASKNKAVTNFAELAGIDFEFLLNANNDSQSKMNYLNTKSATITGDFLDYWNQEKIEIKAQLSGNNLMFGFVEQGKDEIFKMEQRSKGFQWFLSFYIQSNLSDDKKGQHYLLVDEPGLYLHAKAQRDVLSVLEKRSNEVPVIFSTHSPYLIEPDKLNRVQLVFKDKKNGTIVESKLHKISDKETLTPILTAIGLELTSGILNTEKFLNVIVEGPSDFYYYNAFKKIFGNKNLNFIYGGGSGNMPKIGTILHGWGCQVIYLFDNDQGKKDGEKNLTTNWLVDKSQIEVITKKPSSNDIRIEDLFTLEDFVKYVLLEDEAKKYTINNSEYVKKNKFDKVLLAKNFLSSIEDIKVNISKTTKDNFKKVFNLLEPIFKNEPKNNTLI